MRKAAPPKTRFLDLRVLQAKTLWLSRIFCQIKLQMRMAVA